MGIRPIKKNPIARTTYKAIRFQGMFLLTGWSAITRRGLGFVVLLLVDSFKALIIALPDDLNMSGWLKLVPGDVLHNGGITQMT
jgi:hypothetical protein